MAGQSEPSLTLLPLIFDTEKAGNHESRHGGDLDLCHTVVILILPLPWEKQWQLWLSGSGRSSSEPTPRLGSDPKLRFYDWIWSRLRWVIKMIASLMFCLETPGQHLGDEGKDGRQVWKQVLSREVSHLRIIINIGHLKESRLTNMLLHDPIDGNWWWSDSMIQRESGHFSFSIGPGTMFSKSCTLYQVVLYLTVLGPELDVSNQHFTFRPIIVSGFWRFQMSAKSK